jgi:predicted dehydrogenase
MSEPRGRRLVAGMVRNGDLGRIRFVVAEHASGWASAPVEQWRMDPDIGGAASAVADVGTHAFHLLRYITGLEATRLSAELSTLVPGRRVFDNATVRLTLSNGAPATVWATMAATGNENALRIRVFGDNASLEWRHEDPHRLVVRDQPAGATILTQGMSTLSDDAARLTRVGLGHPRASWRHSRTSIWTWPRCCGRAATAPRLPFGICRCPPASTASSVSDSSRRRSRRTPTTPPGSA